MDRYPKVTGIGGQFGEHGSQRCDCAVCSERYFDMQREVFEELARTVRDRNPAVTPWIYDSWGTREIVKAAGRIPGFVNIDWGGAADCLKFHSRRLVPRSKWYLQHGGARRWGEALLRRGTRSLAELGVSGYQIRGAFFREQDEMYHAAQEFAWNPALSEEGFALLHVIRRYHREDTQVADLYALWIRINGRREALKQAESDGWVNRVAEREALASEMARLDGALRRIGERDEFVSDIAEAYEGRRDELKGLARG